MVLVRAVQPMRRVGAALVAVLVALALVPAAQGGRWNAVAADPVGVIVRAVGGAQDRLAGVVERLGGTVTTPLPIISGFAAQVPADRVAELAATPGAAVTPDLPIRLQSLESSDGEVASGYDPVAGETFVDEPSTAAGYHLQQDVGSLERINAAIDAAKLQATGVTGAGVGVALIDTGVVPVPGLTAGVVNGPDLSFENGADGLRYLDTYGHGTHLAGIIAGDAAGDFPGGVAPGATLINVKVASADGAADVSQVLAALDWVVAHRNDPGLNIRVLNLSFGTDGVQDYRLDPLAFAVEQAWRNGIVVVVAAGNGNFGTTQLNNPAYDPFVVTVGAADLGDRRNPHDDSVPEWSARGDAVRHPDVVAPGRSVVSFRNRGSWIDLKHPGGRVANGLFRGTGTSQAAAVASGAVALLLQQRPELTPDQVKALLMATAVHIDSADPVAQGRGLLDIRAAARAPVPANATQTWQWSTGLGSIEAARGSVHVARDGVVISGEIDVFGASWSGASWSGASWSGASWSGGQWGGASWSGASWSGGQWMGASWSGASWSGASWSGGQWGGASWSNGYWAGASWSGASWSGASWSGASWSGASWSGASWSSTAWAP